MKTKKQIKKLNEKIVWLENCLLESNNRLRNELVKKINIDADQLRMSIKQNTKNLHRRIDTFAGKVV